MKNVSDEVYVAICMIRDGWFEYSDGHRLSIEVIHTMVTACKGINKVPAEAYKALIRRKPLNE